MADLDPVRAYLEAPRCAVVSTLARDGSPRQVVLHYWLARDALMLNGRADRLWIANVRRDGRVAIAVHDADDPLHWVGIRGVAEPTADGPAAVEDAQRLAERYGEDPVGYREQERISVRVAPRHVYEYR
jgi:PPOX class probable F420-dependent enzyme